MEDNRNTWRRRGFLTQGLKYTLALPLAGHFLASCGASRKSVVQGTASEERAVGDCEDLTGVDPVDVQKRKALGYTPTSPIQDRRCDNCKLWIPAKEGAPCGGCMLFAGPVNPDGHCTYWAS